MTKEYKAWWDLGCSDRIHSLSEKPVVDDNEQEAMNEVLDDMYRYY